MINLPFKCVEGVVHDVVWFKWYKRRTVLYAGVQHRQFFDVMLIKVTSVHTYAVERAVQDQHVLEDSEDEEDIENEEMDE